MTTWVKSHFSDSKHAMATVSVASLSIGAIGFAIVLLTTIFSK